MRFYMQNLLKLSYQYKNDDNKKKSFLLYLLSHLNIKVLSFINDINIIYLY